MIQYVSFMNPSTERIKQMVIFPLQTSLAVGWMELELLVSWSVRRAPAPPPLVCPEGHAQRSPADSGLLRNIFWGHFDSHIRKPPCKGGRRGIYLTQVQFWVPRAPRTEGRGKGVVWPRVNTPRKRVPAPQAREGLTRECGLQGPGAGQRPGPPNPSPTSPRRRRR